MLSPWPGARKTARSFSPDSIAGSNDRSKARIDRHALDAQFACGLRHRDRRAAEGPSAVERDVHAQPKPGRLLCGEPQVVDVFVGEIALVVKAGCGIIQRLRIERGHLDASDAGRLHLLKLALQFRFGNRGAEPPPAHHDSRVVRRVGEGSLQRIGRGLRAGTREGEQEHRQDNSARFTAAWTRVHGRPF